MATRLISKTCKVAGVLTDVTSAKLSDPTGTYGIKRNDLSAKTITGATQADPLVLTVVGHGLSDSQMIHVSGVSGMTELNGNQYYVDVLSADTLGLYSDSALATSIDGTSGYTAYTAPNSGTETPVEVADGTAMTHSATGIYQYSFTDEENIAYTAYVEFVYGGATFHFEEDIPARAAVGEMVASYSSLLERVGHFLFGIRSGYGADQTTDIEDAITDGLRDVYSAHSWSFFRPNEPLTTTAPYDTGTVTIVDGVVALATGTFPSWAASGVLKVDSSYYEVDTRESGSQVTLKDTSVDADAGSSYELSRLTYDLPTGFESIESRLTYEPGQSDFYPDVEMRHDVYIRSKQQDDPYTDRPLYFSVRTVEFDPTTGSRRRISFYPLANAAYVMNARMTLRPVSIDVTNQYPVGGEMLSQLIVEACLGAAERLYDEQLGGHARRFQELLPLAIRDDQLASSPTTLGPDAPKGENADLVSRSVRMGDITLDGTVL